MMNQKMNTPPLFSPTHRGWMLKIGRGLLLLLLVTACSSPSDTIQQVTPLPPTTLTQIPTALDFELATFDGEKIRLSDLRGKWVLVNFWATWCEPCVAELPVFQQIAQRYPDTLVVLAVNMRETTEDIAAFLAEHPLALTILVQPDDATLANYQVVALPQTLILSPQGEIVWRQFGAVELTTFAAEIAAWLEG